jgi:3'-5' exoribonuclease
MSNEPISALLSIRELKQQSSSSGNASLRGRLHLQVDGVAVKPTRQGGEYAELRLADASDTLTLRIWSDAPQFAMAQRFKPHSFVEIEGDWSSGSYGPESRNWKARPLSQEEMAALLAGPAALREKQAQDYAEIVRLVASLTDPRLRGLCELFLADHGERFRRTGAARDYHHARRGGLVEHVAQMMRAANALCGVYPAANRDLILTGVLFHDSGKLWENSYPADGFSMPYSLHGEMLGHIVMGVELVNKLWRKLLDSDQADGWNRLAPANEDVRLHLLHLIGAHHGEYQFGSPVLPRTPEAILLHYVDNLDAKLEMFYAGYETSERLARGIFERVRPLPANLVEPLAHFGATVVGAAADAPAEDAPEAQNG